MIEPHYRLISNHCCGGYDIIVADWAGSKPTRVISRSDVTVEHRQDAWPLIVAALTGDTALLPPVDPRNPSRTPDPAVYTAPITRIAVIRGESDSLAIDDRNHRGDRRGRRYPRPDAPDLAVGPDRGMA